MRFSVYINNREETVWLDKLIHSLFRVYTGILG